MAGNNEDLKKTFTLFSADALLALEADGQLDGHVDEISPLRRELIAPLPLVWDSRELLLHPAPCFFVARKGHRFDGHTLVEEVIGKGHVVIAEGARLEAHLVSQGRPEMWVDDLLSHPFLIRVNDTELALRTLLDRASRQTPQGWNGVAITGTNGKTSITQMVGFLWETLSQEPIVRMGTLGISIGKQSWEGAYPTMPDYPGFISALSAGQERGARRVVFEATSHGLVERRMGDWLVDVAVFTNLTQDHLDFHKTMEAYRNCKGLLFERHLRQGGTAVVNADDGEWPFFLKKVKPRTHVIGFGTRQNRDAFLGQSKATGRSSRFLEFSPTTTSHCGIEGVWHLWDDGTLTAECEYGSLLLGAFQHSNLTAAAAALLPFGFSLDQIAEHTMQMPGIPGRLEPVTIPDGEGPTVLVDYSHSPDALEKALQTVRGLVPPGGRLVSVFGCGGDRDSTKRPLMGRISERLADVTVVTSDNPRTEDPEAIIDGIMAGIENASPIVREPDRRRAIEGAILGAKGEDIVLIAGKGHENYQIVGTEKRHFSDQEVAADALRARNRNKREERS